jgi:hypothetical protein
MAALATSLHEYDWRTLALSIKQGDCILMLGPDAVTESINSSDVPLMDSFAGYLCDRLRDRVEIPKGCHVIQVAQAFKNAFGGSSDLQAAADEFFQAKEGLRNEVLLNLAALPFRLVINTNPGNQMEDAFRSVDGKQPETDWYQFKGAPKQMVHEGTVETPLVYHLYGNINDPKSLVLAEDDLLDFLVNVVSKSPALPNNILSAFRSKDNCFLFLGFGFKQWHLRMLLHVRYKSGGENRSFALEKFDKSADQISTERTKAFFQEGHKIYFFEMDLPAFTAELRKWTEKSIYQPGRPGERAPVPDAAKVFLCHASEDKGKAEALATKLKDAKIKIWLDRNDLEGGMDWDKAIERAINHEVDFFLVLQSNSLLHKEEAYVNKEIKLALERQKRFRSGMRFIVPVLLDAEAKLSELRDLQSQDITSDDGIQDLISVIKREHQLRKKGRQ